MMNFATGCIFEYDAAHPEGSGIGFKEEDKPNFTGSFYSKTKAMVIINYHINKLHFDPQSLETQSINSLFSFSPGGRASKRI